METVARAVPLPMELRVAPSLGELPHFNPDAHPDDAPESVRTLRRLIADSEALLIVCPEYAFSLPGVLKNSIDWLVGSGELEGKLMAITASVPHPERGLMGLQALRQTLRAVSARVVFDEPIVRGTEQFALGRLFSALLIAQSAQDFSEATGRSS
jgi:chromate reductase, NAD(P)H dehydrogenase (quinone)